MPNRGGETPVDQVVYKTIKDVYCNGIKDNIDWLQIQKSFTFNTYVFKKETFLFVPNRAFLKRSPKNSFLTVYTFPGGNLHFLPFDVEGDFLSCKNENIDLLQQHQDQQYNVNSKVIKSKSEPEHMTNGSEVENNKSLTLEPRQIFTENNKTNMHSMMGDPVKVFKPVLKKKGYTISRSDASKAKDFNKRSDHRFSLFTEKAYVSMAGFTTFEELCNAHAKANKNLTQVDYLEMTHPVVNMLSIFPQEDMFKVKLRKRSKSDAERRSPRSSNTDDNAIRASPLNLESGTIVHENSKKLKASKSINDLTDYKDSDNNFFELPQKFNKNYSFGGSTSADLQKKREKSMKSKITLYNRLMRDVDDLSMKNVKIREYNEQHLRDRVGFNRFESRLIYYSLRGWSPNTNDSTKHRHTFLEDFSVQELSTFLRSLGNTRLAEYFLKYHVDGYMMKLIILDDLLLDEQLFDESFLQIEQLVHIRREYFPKRSRCNAISGRKDSNNNIGENGISFATSL